MSFAPFIAAAVPTVLALLLAVWVTSRVLRARPPARIEARIAHHRRRRGH